MLQCPIKIPGPSQLGSLPNRSPNRKARPPSGREKVNQVKGFFELLELWGEVLLGRCGVPYSLEVAQDYPWSCAKPLPPAPPSKNANGPPPLRKETRSKNYCTPKNTCICSVFAGTLFWLWFQGRPHHSYFFGGSPLHPDEPFRAAATA